MAKYVLFDCITDKFINIEQNSVISSCSELGIDYTCLSKLGKTQNYIKDRYILSTQMDKITILVDADSGAEYKCISNATLFIHLGLDYNSLEAKYISALRNGKQSFASICGKVFYVKDNAKRRIKKLKNNSIKVNELRSIQREQAYIRSVVQNRIRKAIEDARLVGECRKMNYLGCSNEFFYKYIENRFTTKMNWHNRNLWDIDHIKPCSEYDLTKKSERKKCFHYTNLQPIWSTTKIAKEMGEPEFYVGNRNKNSTGLQYDYKLEELLRNNFPILRGHTVNFCVGLFSIGFRKIL